MASLVDSRPRLLSSLLHKSPRKRRVRDTTPDLRLGCAPITIDDNPDQGRDPTVCGQLVLAVASSEVTIEQLECTLEIVTRCKRSSHRSRANCRKQTTEIQTWSLIKTPVTFARGTHEFCVLEAIPRHLPPSIALSALDLSYQLRATAISVSGANQSSSSSSTPQTLQATEQLSISRVSSTPLLPSYLSSKSSSTGIGFCTLFDSIQINSANNISIQISGLHYTPKNNRSGYTWTILRADWMLEETIHILPQVSRSHDRQATCIGDEEKHCTTTRRLASGHLDEGWRPVAGDTSSVTMDMIVDMAKKANKRPICSYDDPEFDMIKVEHVLSIELSVVLERLSGGESDDNMRVGGGRIVKTRYPVVLVHPAEDDYDKAPPPTYDEDEYLLSR